jgi:hypothetical protein
MPARSSPACVEHERIWARQGGRTTSAEGRRGPVKRRKGGSPAQNGVADAVRLAYAGRSSPPLCDAPRRRREALGRWNGIQSKGQVTEGPWAAVVSRSPRLHSNGAAARANCRAIASATRNRPQSAKRLDERRPRRPDVGEPRRHGRRSRLVIRVVGLSCR